MCAASIEIIYQKASGAESELRMQLLVDEGPAAEAAAISMQQDLKLHPERYRGASPYAGGYGDLSSVIQVAGSVQGSQPSGNAAVAHVSPTNKVDTQQMGRVSQQQFKMSY